MKADSPVTSGLPAVSKKSWVAMPRVTVAPGCARISSLTELSSAQFLALSAQDDQSAAETVVAASASARIIAANRFTLQFLLFYV